MTPSLSIRQRVERWLERFPVFWQSQIWIKLPRVMICVGYLPMYAGMPWGLWIGVRRHPNLIENLDRTPTAILTTDNHTGRYHAKPFVRILSARWEAGKFRFTDEP